MEPIKRNAELQKMIIQSHEKQQYGAGKSNDIELVKNNNMKSVISNNMGPGKAKIRSQE